MPRNRCYVGPSMPSPDRTRPRQLPRFAMAAVAAVLLLAGSRQARAQSPEGFGENTTGGAGKPVVMVTTLDDYDPNVGPVITGSLRWAMSGSNRQIRFAVGGDIVLATKLS